MRRRRDRVVAFLDRLSRALDDGTVVLTLDAASCAEGQFGWDEGDVLAFLRVLDASDFWEQVPSTAIEGGVIWIFLPITDDGRIFLRLCERESIIVVSLHRG